MIYVITILWVGVIFLLSSIPGSDIPAAPGVMSFVVHYFEYTILGLLLTQVVIRKFKIQNSKFKNKVFIILLIGFMYAMSDEIHQIFVPGRNFELIDLLIDGIGLLVGIFVVFLTQKSKWY